jgi:hypothetical protein
MRESIPEPHGIGSLIEMAGGAVHDRKRKAEP